MNRNMPDGAFCFCDAFKLEAATLLGMQRSELYFSGECCERVPHRQSLSRNTRAYATWFIETSSLQPKTHNQLKMSPLFPLIYYLIKLLALIVSSCGGLGMCAQSPQFTWGWSIAEFFLVSDLPTSEYGYAG